MFSLNCFHKFLQYAAKEFGTCPLFQCGGQPVLPVSLKDEMGADTVKTYCPKCSQVYHPPPVRSRTGSASGVDGSAFGTTFPHLFLMTFSNLVPDPLPADSTYVPRIFGFRIHKSARQRFSPPAALPASRSAVAVAENIIKKQSPEDDEESKSPPALEHINGGPMVVPRAVGNGGGDEVAPVPVQLGVPMGDDSKRSPRGAGTKRRSKEGPSSNTDGAVSPSGPPAGQKDASNGAAAPNFLTENPVKRRRRNNNSNSA